MKDEVEMKSRFQFTNPTLKELLFKVIPETPASDEEISLKFTLSGNIIREKKQPKAEVSLTFETGKEEKGYPFWLKATETAFFRWDSSMEEAEIDKMLRQNAPALLLSYLRPAVAQVTGNSKFHAINIPFMNFVEKDIFAGPEKVE